MWSSSRSRDSIVVAPEENDAPPHTPPNEVAPLALPKTKKPRKLTPLEKKQRDRMRMKEQAQRHKQAVKDQFNLARRFAQDKQSSSDWHQQERQEEELVLRRLERDIVDVQRSHSAAAGYCFASNRANNAAISSPVFLSYSHALCPPSQAPRRQLQSRGGLQKMTNVPREASYLHPACRGYAMARHDDSRCISPVFFLTGFAKIPLDKVITKQDDDSDEETDDEQDVERDELGANEDCHISAQAKALQQETQRRLKAVMAARELSPAASEVTKNNGDSSTVSSCLVCKQSGITAGCPGCFSFSRTKYLDAGAFKVTQRLKSAKTALQEEEDRRARHKLLQKQIIIPPLFPKNHQNHPDTSPEQVQVKEGETRFYLAVLPDSQAIQMHRAVANKFITLHIKSLPVGQLISLRVDLKSSVTYLYELYRANTELPNRPLHLLLPTTRGLFYFNEQIEVGTYTRNGIVNGELLLEDFNLQKSAPFSRGGILNIANSSNNNSSEFLLFAVAILHPRSTPQLVLNFVQQNFHFEPPEDRSLAPLVISVDNDVNVGLPPWTKLVPATFLLPKAVDQDPFQVQIRPHIPAMHVFAKINYAIVAAEQREERERILLLAHQEAKAAKLELKRKLRDQLQTDVSNKVRRALKYFEFVCDSTSNPRQPRVAEERLGKLWQFMQMMEEWKILKAGRLIDAERTNVTLALLQQLEDTTIAAFGQMMDGGKRLPTDSGGGTLPYPVLCLEGSGGAARKLVLRLGTRMGVTQHDNYDYGMILDLDQDFDALEKNEPRTKFKRTVPNEAEDEAAEPWADVEWRIKGRGSSTIAMMVSSADLLKAPFFRVQWPLIVKAYKLAMRRVAFVSAKLDQFNALARVLQSPDAVLSKVQLAKWQTDVEAFLATLHDHSALAHATTCVLTKKGLSVLKRRAQARRKQLRERETEMQRLRELQLERDQPKLTFAQQLKVVFLAERAPKLREAVELTPAEKLGAKAGELLGKAASSVVSAARNVKKEYVVRTL